MGRQEAACGAGGLLLPGDALRRAAVRLNVSLCLVQGFWLLAFQFCVPRRAEAAWLVCQKPGKMKTPTLCPWEAAVPPRAGEC